jgi:mRNA-degrading endonuclease RelE of RelBE toxin-antitoxin system
MTVAMHKTQTLLEKIQSLPEDRFAQVEDFVDFLRERTKREEEISDKREPLDFPVDNPGPWPEKLSLRREDMYGDNGR